MSKQSSVQSSVYKVPRSRISVQTERQLYGRSAGRCEFQGCNRFLLEHHVTFARGNFAKKAHIVAYSGGGPRALEDFDRQVIDDETNLMLVCPTCHDLIDGDPGFYTVELLRGYKQVHEGRVYRLTDISISGSPRVIALSACVRGQAGSITDPEIGKALHPEAVDPRDIVRFDFNEFDDRAPGYWTTIGYEVRKRIQSYIDNPPAGQSTQPIQVFAVARMPVLILMGSLLSSKVPAEALNRHATRDDWQWQEDDRTDFKWSWLERNDVRKPVVVVSLSGKIAKEAIPAEFQHGRSIMEITVRDGNPRRTCLSSSEAQRRFRDCYQDALAQLRVTRPESIDIIPAIPVAGAFHIGRDVLPTFDPPIRVFDWNGGDGYDYTITINEHD
jgi:hypothetical protein